MANRKSYIIWFTVLSIVAAVLLPARPQPVAYHNFADHRAMFGIANFLDVASNIGFLLTAIAGLAAVLRPCTRFEFSSERWPYALFFLGMLLTAVGSAYYHLAPDNERLFWDRLPMTIAFMALIAGRSSIKSASELDSPCSCQCCWWVRLRSSIGGRPSAQAWATSCRTVSCKGIRW